MKKILAAVLLWAGFAACSSNSKETGQDAQVPLTETEKLKKDIAAWPDSLQLRDELINLYFEQGDFTAGIAEVDKVLAKDSTNAYFWALKGNLHGFNDDTANAIRALERSTALNPLPENLMALGYLYADTRNEQALVVGDALIIADKAAAKKEGLLIKGIYYAKTGKEQTAITLFDEALEESYTFKLAYREKAIVQYNLGRYADALKTLQKGTTLQNDFDEGYYWMGRCYEKMGKTTEAIDSYKKALLYAKGDYAEASDALGRLGVK